MKILLAQIVGGEFSYTVQPASASAVMKTHNVTMWFCNVPTGPSAGP
jgi:hypothetical protein